MSKQFAFLKYNFLFDTAETWSNLSQFETALTSFFESHNMEARVIKTIEGQLGDRIMYIEKKEDAPEIEVPKETPKVIQPEVKKQGLPKGGKLLPKVKNKKIKFSYKKGRRLPQNKRFKATLGGRK